MSFIRLPSSLHATHRGLSWTNEHLLATHFVDFVNERLLANALRGLRGTSWDIVGHRGDIVGHRGTPSRNTSWTSWTSSTHLDDEIEINMPHLFVSYRGDTDRAVLITPDRNITIERPDREIVVVVVQQSLACNRLEVWSEDERGRYSDTDPNNMTTLRLALW